MASPASPKRIVAPHELTVTGNDRPEPPTDIADLLVDWVVSPNHNEIVVVDEA